jgi:hypothetical protein
MQTVIIRPHFHSYNIKSIVYKSSSNEVSKRANITSCLRVWTSFKMCYFFSKLCNSWYVLNELEEFSLLRFVFSFHSKEMKFDQAAAWSILGGALLTETNL